MDEPFEFPNAPDPQISAVAALENATSATAYEAVLARGRAGRDQVAADLGVARSVAAFHLDKLVDAGLLEATFERTTGRTGPGAGRPAKLYRRADCQIDLTIPPRRYDLAGSVLAGAVARSIDKGIGVGDALGQVARERGREAGGAAGPGTQGLLDLLVLHGFSPRLTAIRW
jgi:predicted ArsR family transcriptional regulator